MNIFNAFKSKLSKQNMTAEDRARLFWFLQRKTSYTAWKRASDAFDGFAEVFKRQVKEEPVAKADASICDTCWEESFSDVVRGQVLYEKGLEALGAGDRTVWLRNERGILEVAERVSGNWYDELVNHGMHGDHYQDGKYLQELTEAIKLYSIAFRDVSQIIQPMMADTPAPYLWTTFWKDDFALLPLPPILTEPPSPKTAVLIRTNAVAPAFGIYEPQIKDGCMNYLLGGVPAPTVLESDGTYSTGRKLSVTWRLLWEDTRYLDRRIPDEEKSYFPPAQTVEPVVQRTVPHELIAAETHEICPRSGEWAVMDEIEAKLFVARGQKLPPHKGRNVNWVWLRT
jgi:ribosomal protein L31E